MKLSVRMKLFFGLAALFVMMASSAWADVNSVVQAVENYGLTATVSGNTITVTGGTSSSPIVLTGNHLDLGDISGLVIDWKASVTAAPNGDRGYLVKCNGNGTLKIADGLIKLPDTYGRWITAFLPGSDVNMLVSGGTIQGSREQDCAISVDTEYGSGAGTVTIDGGIINIPNALDFTHDSGAITAPLDKVVVNTPQSVTGIVLEYDKAEKLVRITIYGVTLSGANITVEAGEIFNIHGTLRIPANGKMVNKGTINNYSNNTLDNQGTLTNNGTINNKATGKITNSGTIVNEGKIANEGTVVNNGTIKSDPANFTGNSPTGTPIESGTPTTPTNPNTGKSSGGGCNTGLGMVGLLFAGWAALKNRKA